MKVWYALNGVSWFCLKLPGRGVSEQWFNDADHPIRDVCDKALQLVQDTYGCKVSPLEYILKITSPINWSMYCLPWMNIGIQSQVFSRWSTLLMKTQIVSSCLYLCVSCFVKVSVCLVCSQTAWFHLRLTLVLIGLQVVDVAIPEIEEMRLAHYITIASESSASIGVDFWNLYVVFVILTS